LSDLENTIKYLLAVAEHGNLKYVTVDPTITPKDLESIYDMYPFLLDEKYSLICSPSREPTNCRLTSPGFGVICEKPLYSHTVTCYNPVTGSLFSKSESEKLFEDIKKMHKICMIRFNLHLKNIYAPPKVSEVPVQENPVPPPDVEEPAVKKDIDELSRIIANLKSTYGTPEKTAPPTPPKPPPTPPPKKPSYKMCISLANEFGYPELKDAIASGNKDAMMSALKGLSEIILSSDEALIDYTEYARKLRICQHEIEKT